MDRPTNFVSGDITQAMWIIFKGGWEARVVDKIDPSKPFHTTSKPEWRDQGPPTSTED